jgi:hypothetical protein
MLPWDKLANTAPPAGTKISLPRQSALIAPLENSKAQLDNHHATATARLDMEGAQESHLKHLAPRAWPEGIPSRDNLAKTAGQESTQPPQELQLAKIGRRAAGRWAEQSA